MAATVETLDSFRRRLRAFLAEHHPGKASKEDRLAAARRFAASLADHGFAAPAWPKRFGGMELPVAHQLVYHEEMARAAPPVSPAAG